jgi:hypothetical protein
MSGRGYAVTGYTSPIILPPKSPWPSGPQKLEKSEDLTFSVTLLLRRDNDPVEFRTPLIAVTTNDTTVAETANELGAKNGTRLLDTIAKLKKVFIVVPNNQPVAVFRFMRAKDRPGELDVELSLRSRDKAGDKSVAGLRLSGMNVRRLTPGPQGTYIAYLEVNVPDSDPFILDGFDGGGRKDDGSP